MDSADCEQTHFMKNKWAKERFKWRFSANGNKQYFQRNEFISIIIIMKENLNPRSVSQTLHSFKPI